MNSRMQKVVILVVALVLVLPLGAVGLLQAFGPGEGDVPAATAPADTRPAVDPASQPSPSPTTAPALPAGLTEQSADGAQATARYTLESYAYMMAIGDMQAWGAVIDGGCQVCQSFLSNATQLHSQAGYQSGGVFTVTGTTFEGTGEPPASGTVTLQVTQDPAVIIDDPTREGVDVPGFAGEMQMVMVWDGTQWRVGDMAITADSGSVSDGGGAQG
ncbi:DUF6318 family protein [Brachybacterium sp. JHP9]|uniref:DUF6318 family protein n=1 Tax=Brachybacterium equifaecis TaxID=2910770 RepID=A0ABT0QZY0_9MICO|nr:DUF6318 family protein [Brachybacterium equifaecis]MCL6423095.1 DUF6318 family protein [Brachybacterium equifaecis]